MSEQIRQLDPYPSGRLDCLDGAALSALDGVRITSSPCKILSYLEHIKTFIS